MLINTEYNRNKAIEYAERWAFDRNPRYLDFEKLGGDCTNYVSQCIYAG
ncbi:MAG TPA: amidase domain-containing protein, partial [Bacillota bacterium]|nr:amidase domain-containing protein [Bacillota bacterium]